MAREYWIDIREADPENAHPANIEDAVFALLEILWAHRIKNKPKQDQKGPKKSKKKSKEFPELVPCLQEDEDSD